MRLDTTHEHTNGRQASLSVRLKKRPHVMRKWTLASTSGVSTATDTLPSTSGHCSMLATTMGTRWQPVTKRFGKSWPRSQQVT